MTAPPLTRPQLTVDLRALRANWTRLGEVATGCAVAAMVKADGYGVGAIPVAEALRAEGCEEFFVAEIGEAITLRQVMPDIAIFVLAGAQPGTEHELLHHDLTPVLISIEQIDRWVALAGEHDRALRASVHLDTGMNRTGLDRTDTENLLADPSRLDGLDVVHLMSHLASADDDETSQNERQLAAFQRIRDTLTVGKASLANTPGIALGPRFHFDHVRPGIGLYGADPSPHGQLGITPVVRLDVPVLQTRTVAAGETVGYSASHTTTGERTLATLAVGYGDGFLRSQSGHGMAAFDGHRAPIVGRVSMDLITVDITDLPAEVAVAPGSAAELIGPTITIDEVAEAAGTIPYEILTALGHRYLRRHIG